VKIDDCTPGLRVYFARCSTGHEGWIWIRASIVQASEFFSKVYLKTDTRPPIKDAWVKDMVFLADVRHLEPLSITDDTCICNIARVDCVYHRD